MSNPTDSKNDRPSTERGGRSRSGAGLIIGVFVVTILMIVYEMLRK